MVAILATSFAPIATALVALGRTGSTGLEEAAGGRPSGRVVLRILLPAAAPAWHWRRS
jgi:hypothetical protein